MKPLELGRLLYGKTPRFTQNFGYTDFSHHYIHNFHTGVDYARGIASPIYAPCDFTVESVFYSFYGYGHSVVGKMYGVDNQLYSIRFGHFGNISVRKGERVRKGQRVGFQGSTGFSTGPHLHFEVYRGDIDPYLFSGDYSRYLSAWVNPLDLDRIVKIKLFNMEEVEVLKQEIASLHNTVAAQKSVMEGLDARMQEVREGVLQIVNLQFAEQERGRLDAIYERLLGRKSDLSGRLSFYMLSDEQVENIIKESEEYKNKNEGNG